MEIIFRVPGEPQGKERPRFMRNGHTYTPTKTRAYEERVRNEFKLSGCRMLNGPIQAEIMALYPIPKSYTKAKAKLCRLNQVHPVKKPDADNIAKAVLDALNGIAYEDDSAVVFLKVSKRYSSNDNPMVIVNLKEIEDEIQGIDAQAERRAGLV